VRGVVSREEGGFRVVLEVNDAQRRSSRSLSADDCADLTEAAALAIALAVQAQEARPDPAGATQAPAETSPVLGAARHAGPGPAEQSLAEQQERGRSTGRAGLAWSLGVEAVLDTGALPAVAPGVGVAGRASFGAPSIEIHGAVFPLQSLDVSQREQVEFGLMLVGARGCYRFFGSAPSAAACVGFEAGSFEASGDALLGSRRWRDIWLAPSAGVEGRQPLAAGWQLVLRGEAVMPLLRKQYVVNENDSVHAPAGVDLRLSLGLSVGTD
jgi:hypothetical protein